MLNITAPSLYGECMNGGGVQESMIDEPHSAQHGNSGQISVPVSSSTNKVHDDTGVAKNIPVYTPDMTK